MSTPNRDDSCHCGAASCSLHDTTLDMQLASHYLKKLNDTQRARILCWYCSRCCRELPPGDGECPCPKE